MTMTEADRTAADVAWDIEPLVDGEAEAGVDALLEEADTRARELAKYRGRVGELDAAGLAVLMQELGAIGDLAGRADSYAGLRFAVDTQDPANGALIARAEEKSTAINNELIFIELEWAAVDDDRAAALLADEQLAFCRHHLESARRYRPHLSERAGGGHPLRQVAHREQRVGAALLGAHLRDHRRARRRRGEPRGGTLEVDVARSRRAAHRGRGRHGRAGTRVAHPRLRVQHAAGRQVDR